jgi:hypothetical protein
MSRGRIGAAVAAGALLLAAHGDAAVLCRRGTGKIVLRQACRKAEQVLDASRLDLSALAGEQGLPGAPGPRGQHPLKLVDAAGTELGPIQTFSVSDFAAVLVTHPALGVPVQFSVRRAGFVHNVGGAESFVAYTAADCAGVPYLPSGVTSVVRGQVYGNAAYYPTGPLQSRNILSSESDPDGNPCSGGATATGRGTCCSNVSATTNLAPGARVPLADLGFTPPFQAIPR